MQFRMTIDECTQLGALLDELPERKRQAKLLELATVGMYVMTNAGLQLGIFSTATVPLEVRQPDKNTNCSDLPAAEQVKINDSEEFVDFGDLPDN